MLLHVDSLSPARWDSQRFLAVYRVFDPVDVPRDVAWELAVFLRTPGFARHHFHLLFDWDHGPVLRGKLAVVEAYFAKTPSVLAACADNLASIELADGLHWLRHALQHQPKYRGSVPLWTQLAIQGLMNEGTPSLEIARQLDLVGPTELYAAKLLQRWAKRASFDPLTGLALGSSVEAPILTI